MSIQTNNNLNLPDDVATLQSLLREQYAIVSTLSSQLQVEKLGRERAEWKVKDLLRRMFGIKCSQEHVTPTTGWLLRNWSGVGTRH